MSEARRQKKEAERKRLEDWEKNQRGLYRVNPILAHVRSALAQMRRRAA